MPGRGAKSSSTEMPPVPVRLPCSCLQMSPWTEERFLEALGPCARELLETEIQSSVAQTERVEEYFAKIWPPPNV